MGGSAPGGLRGGRGLLRHGWRDLHRPGRRCPPGRVVGPPGRRVGHHRRWPVRRGRVLGAAGGGGRGRGAAVGRGGRTRSWHASRSYRGSTAGPSSRPCLRPARRGSRAGHAARRGNWFSRRGVDDSERRTRELAARKGLPWFQFLRRPLPPSNWIANCGVPGWRVSGWTSGSGCSRATNSGRSSSTSAATWACGGGTCCCAADPSVHDHRPMTFSS